MSVVVEPMSTNSDFPLGAKRPAHVARACQFAAATACGRRAALSNDVKLPVVSQIAIGVVPAASRTAARIAATPSALVEKQSASSAVIVTANRSD